MIDIAVTERAIKRPACPVAPGGDFSAVYTNTFGFRATNVTLQNVGRTVSHVKIYLPLGSSEGDYEIRVLAPGEKVLFTANGVASVQQEIMPLNNP